MTSVHFAFKTPQGAPKTGKLRIVPIKRHTEGANIIPLLGFDVDLASDGTKTVQLTPTDNTYAWRVTEFPGEPECSYVRTVQVPNSQSTVEYADLVDVDANTLAPALNTGAALTYLLASSLQEAQAMSAANPGQMVFYPEGQAKTVASQILEDLTDARAVVEAQSAVAAQAANAAQAASVQAADAVQAVSEQTAQVSANAAAVQSVADSITESKSVVESHANEALTAIDEAVKSVKDKASDVSGEDRTDAMPTDSTDSASSQEA